MKEQFELFRPDGEPTDEALQSGPTETPITEETLSDLTIAFENITGHKPSSYELNTLPELKAMVEELRQRPSDVMSILLARSTALDQASRQNKPKDRYWDN